VKITPARAGDGRDFTVDRIVVRQCERPLRNCMVETPPDDELLVLQDDSNVARTYYFNNVTSAQ